MTPPTPAPTPDSTPRFKAYSGYDPDPCYRAGDKDAADLCAQWRSAIAAEKAAHEARRATNWMIIATFLSAATVAGLITSIWQTFRALGEARRGNRINLLFERRARREARLADADTKEALRLAALNAEAAAEQARTASDALANARDFGQREIRAYINIIHIAWHVPPGTGDVSVQTTFENSGATPAFDVSNEQQIGFLQAQDEDEPITIDALMHLPPIEKFYHGSKGTYARAERQLLRTSAKEWPRDTFELVRQRRAIIFVRGWAEYKDVFGHIRTTTWFRYCNDRTLAAEQEFFIAPFYNEMT